MGITVVTIKIVREIFNYQISDATASRRINECRDALNKKKCEIITKTDFCNYFGISFEN
ncbi:MAG: hypothetical protein Q7U47_01365 [Paludibacter sp.]|nr:hypothetical protein [Paludibacter sp.]